MKYYTVLIMALTSLALTGFFHRLRSRLPNWNILTKSQKVALVSFISLIIMLPVITLATMGGSQLSSRADTPITSPITPPTTPPSTATPTPEPNAIPVITITSLPPGILNRRYTATISGYDLDETDILSLSTSGLPAGLRQDKCALSVVYGNAVITCMLTGRPLQAGTYPVTIKLEDNRGGKTTKVLLLRIVRAEEAN